MSRVFLKDLRLLGLSEGYCVGEARDLIVVFEGRGRAPTYILWAI